MKKFSFLPIVALVLAVAASAFTNKNPILDRNLETFVYTGNTVQDQDDPNQYVLLSTNPAVTCGGQEVIICRIWAEPDGTGDHPDFSSANPLDDPEEFDVISKRPSGE